MSTSSVSHVIFSFLPGLQFPILGGITRGANGKISILVPLNCLAVRITSSKNRRAPRITAQSGNTGSSGAIAMIITTVDVAVDVMVDVPVDVAVVAVPVAVEVTVDDAVLDWVEVAVLVSVEVAVLVNEEVLVDDAVDEAVLVSVVVNVGTQSGGLPGSAGETSMKRVKSHGTQQYVLLPIPDGKGLPSTPLAVS